MNNENNESKITVFLDFDGVLFDTLKEAYVLCRNVCWGIDIFADIEDDIYERFYRYKFLVFNSWQYFYLMKTLQKTDYNTSDDDFISLYKSYISNRIRDEEDVFEKKYMEQRKWLIDNYSEYVDKLEEKFPIFDKIMTLKQDSRFDLMILSRKNSFAIKRKGVDIKIIGKEELINVVNKSEFIEKYMREHNVTKAYFVDDNSHNLEPCALIKGLRCLLAGWGNCGIDEKGLTQEDVFNIIVNNL